MERTIFLLVSTLLVWINQSIVCTPASTGCISGKGKIVTQSRDIKDFTKIKVLGSMDVEIISGDKYAVEVTDYENLLPYLKTVVHGDKLEIGYEGCIRNSRASVKITMPELNGIYSLGSGDIKVSGEFASTQGIFIESLGSGDIIFNALLDGSQEVSVTLKGSGDLRFNTVAQSLNLVFSSLGSGDAVINIPGQVNDLTINLAGSGDVVAKGDSASTARVKVLGSGDCDIQDIKVSSLIVKLMGSGDVHATVENELDVNIMGSGDVYYHGNPGKVVVNSVGSGSLIKQ